jgi:hypothetical protein
MTALVVLGLIMLAAASGTVGWLVAARRHQATEASLQQEIQTARTNAEESHRRHEAIVGELTRTALRVIRSQGGESL